MKNFLEVLVILSLAFNLALWLRVNYEQSVAMECASQLNMCQMKNK